MEGNSSSAGAGIIIKVKVAILCDSFQFLSIIVYSMVPHQRAEQSKNRHQEEEHSSKDGNPAPVLTHAAFEKPDIADMYVSHDQ